MNKDRLAGAAENLAGRATSTTGTLIGDDRMIARGKARQFSGRRRNIAGSIRDIFGLKPRPLARRPAVRPAAADPSPVTHSAKESIMNEDEIKGGLRYVKGKVEKGVGDVTTDTKWQVDGVIDQVAGGAQNLYGRAKETVSDVIDGAPEMIADAGDRARDAANRGRALANEHVRDNPWMLVAGAGLAGYTLSWLLHGRRD